MCLLVEDIICQTNAQTSDKMKMWLLADEEICNFLTVLTEHGRIRNFCLLLESWLHVILLISLPRVDSSRGCLLGFSSAARKHIFQPFRCPEKHCPQQEIAETVPNRTSHICSSFLLVPQTELAA